MLDRILHAIFWICLCGLVAVFAKMARGDEPPRDDYATAYAAAQHTGKPLIVLIGAKWCPPCCQARQHEPVFRRLGHYAHLDVDRDGQFAAKIRGALPMPVLLVYRWQQAKREWRVEQRLSGLDKIEAWIAQKTEAGK